MKLSATAAAYDEEEVKKKLEAKEKAKRFNKESPRLREMTLTDKGSDMFIKFV